MTTTFAVFQIGSGTKMLGIFRNSEADAVRAVQAFAKKADRGWAKGWRSCTRLQVVEVAADAVRAAQASGRLPEVIRTCAAAY